MVTTAASIGRRFGSLEQEAFLGLWRKYDQVRVREDELFARSGLTPQQYNVLCLLRRDHPASVRTLDLAACLVRRAPGITRLLDKLEQRGHLYCKDLETLVALLHAARLPHEDPYSPWR